MEILENTGPPLNIFYLFSAFTSDVILEYAFGQSHNYLEREDLNEDFYHMMDSIHHMGAAARQFGWLLPLLLSIPEWIMARVDKGMAAFATMQNVKLLRPISGPANTDEIVPAL
jgi:hypothetical protein